MIATVIITSLLLQCSQGILPDLTKIAPPIPPCVADPNHITNVLTKLSSSISSATFSPFLPLMCDEDFEKGHSGYKPKSQPNEMTKSKRSIEKKNYG